MITDFIQTISSLGKKTLPEGSQLLLYGSRARGNAHENSDWDLLIILKKDKQDFSDFDRYSYPFILIGANRGEIVSAQIYTQREWDSMSFTPFYKNVECDKIQLI